MRKLLLLGLGVLLASGPLPIPNGVPATPASAAPAPLCDVSNRESFPITALGHPSGSAADRYDGSVRLLLETKPDQTIVQTIVRQPAAARRNGGQFGASVALGDLDDPPLGDGCPDVLVGAPGFAGRKGAAAAGAVFVFRGATRGVLASAARTLVPPRPQAGSEFGRALAIGADTGKAGVPRTHLWVGAPGLDVGGKRDAGGVYHYEFNSAGIPRFVQLVTRATRGVPGKPRSGDRFGEVLAAVGLYRRTVSMQAVLVGIPHADVAGRRDAGAAMLLRFKISGRGILGKAKMWTQNSKGVADRAEAGDQFGATVTDRAVGVPGEDLGRRRDAGLVQVFETSRSRRTLVPWRAFTQDTRGVPDKAEAGDRFGAALARGPLCREQVSHVAVGSPGEDLGGKRDVGTVTLLYLPSNSEPPCNPLFLRQGQGPLHLSAGEAGDQFGATLTTGEGHGWDEDYTENLLIGVPGEDSAGRDSGVVHEVALGDTIWYTKPAARDFAGPSAGARYGEVIGVWQRSRTD